MKNSKSFKAIGIISIFIISYNFALNLYNQNDLIINLQIISEQIDSEIFASIASSPDWPYFYDNGSGPINVTYWIWILITFGSLILFFLLGWIATKMYSD